MLLTVCKIFQPLILGIGQFVKNFLLKNHPSATVQLIVKLVQ